MNKLALMGGKKLRTKPFPSGPVIGKEERKLVAEVLDSGKLSGFIAQPGEHFLGGPKVKALEELFKDTFSIPYAVSANSATAGLHMAIAAAGIDNAGVQCQVFAQPLPDRWQQIIIGSEQGGLRCHIAFPVSIA
jgi:dTDP-4-amino-4,6-dideoxygalactose transaminase